MQDVDPTDSGSIDCNRIDKIRCDGVWSVGLNHIEGLNDTDTTNLRLDILDYLGPGYVVSEAFANNDGPFISVHDMTGYVNDAFYYNEQFVYDPNSYWVDHCFYLHRFMKPLPGFDPDNPSTHWPDGCGLNGSYVNGYDPNTYPILNSWWPESKTTLSPIQLAGIRYHLASQGYPDQRITVHVRNYSTTLDDENDPNSHTQYRLKRTFDSDPKLDAVTVEWFPYPPHIKNWKIGDLIHEHLTAGHRVFLWRQ